MAQDLYPAMPELKAGKKKIIICCDGTGNEFGDANSNVVRLYTALRIDDAQVGYYHPGVGTMGNPSIRNGVPRWWSKVRGLAFGYGFKENVLDAYRYLTDTYNDGDAVYIFGFSRGAYTARTLAGLLDGYGLLCKGNEGHIQYAWRLYLDQLKNRDRQMLDHGKSSAAAFKETFSHGNFRIHFIGLWDTVSSVGWVSAPLRLFNIAQNPTVNHARHAVSIDERRCFYQDNLFGEPLPRQTVQQVWFAGAHSDIGGSYPQVTTGLANISLEWMLEEAAAAGVTFVPSRREMLFGKLCEDYPQTSHLYEEHAAKTVHDSLKGPWWLLEVLPHRYYDKDDRVEQKRVPLGAWRSIPSGALIHHSVHERLSDPAANYHPKNVTKDELKEVPKAHPWQSVPLYSYEPCRSFDVNGFTRITGLVISWIAIIALGLTAFYGLVYGVCYLLMLLFYGLSHAAWVPPHLKAARKHLEFLISQRMQR